MADDDVRVRRLAASDAPLAGELFAAYRVFYGQPHDPAVAERYLRERLGRSESVVLLAQSADGEALGLCQLYPGFDSVAAAASWVLSDLYVPPAAQRRGLGSLLLAAAAREARAAGAISLTLSTARTNEGAQRLYERSGYVRDDVYLHYERPLRP